MDWATVVVSALISAIVAKTIAAYHFHVIDSYVKDMIELAKREIESAYASQGKH